MSILAGSLGTIIAAGLGAAATVTTGIISANQARAAAEQQAQAQQSYYDSITAEKEATVATEKRITEETRSRARDYAAGLLASDTNLYSVLNPSGYNSEETTSTPLLGNALKGGVSSMFA